MSFTIGFARARHRLQTRGLDSFRSRPSPRNRQVRGKFKSSTPEKRIPTTAAEKTHQENFKAKKSSQESRAYRLSGQLQHGVGEKYAGVDLWLQHAAVSSRSLGHQRMKAVAQRRSKLKHSRRLVGGGHIEGVTGWSIVRTASRHRLSTDNAASRSLYHNSNTSFCRSTIRPRQISRVMPPLHRHQRLFLQHSAWSAICHRRLSPLRLVAFH